MTEPHRHSTGITLTGGSLRPCISILLRRAPVETTPQVSAKASGPRSAERRVHASGDYTGCCVTQRNVSHHIHCNLRVRCSELVRGIASAAILLARSGKSVPRRRDRWLCGSSLRAQADGGRRVHRHRIVALAEPGGDDSRGLLADLSGRSLLRALVCQITRSNPLHGGTSTLGGSLGPEPEEEVVRNSGCDGLELPRSGTAFVARVHPATALFTTHSPGRSLNS